MMVFLVGCATAPPENTTRMINAAALSAQGACYAVEIADEPTREMRDECIRQKYDLCRKYFASRRAVWYSSGWSMGHRGQNGYPRHTHEMRFEMAKNRCNVDFK